MKKKTVITDLFTEDSKEFDTPKKNNRSQDFTFTEAFMQNLKEAGLTFEMLKEIEGKVEVFKYRTQITIHGKFPETQVTRIFGYKNCVRNENGSLGIRYNAVDVKKKKELHEMLSFVSKHKKMPLPGLRRNSSEMVFEMESRKFEVVKKMYDCINTSLFYGRKYLYKAAHPLFGIYYVVQINIGVIEQSKLLDIFTNWTGMSLEEFNTLKAEVKEQQRNEEEDRKEKSEKINEACQNNYDEALRQLQHLQPWEGQVHGGCILVCATKNPERPVFQYARLEKGSFGRIKIAMQKATELTGPDPGKYGRENHVPLKELQKDKNKAEWYVYHQGNQQAAPPKQVREKQPYQKHSNPSVHTLQPVNAEGLELRIYKNGVAVFGKTWLYAKQLGKDGLKGKPNGGLTHPVTGEKTFGWIFSKEAIPKIEAHFNIKLIMDDNVQSEAA